jgi:hypothetical protein
MPFGVWTGVDDLPNIGLQLATVSEMLTAAAAEPQWLSGRAGNHDLST